MEWLSHNWIHKFSTLFIEKILPYDTNLTILSGTKHYKYYREVYKVFINGFKKENYENIDEYINSNLFPLIRKLSYNYALKLQEIDEVSTLDLTEYNAKMKEQDYDGAIDYIESKLDINKSKNNILNSQGFKTEDAIQGLDFSRNLEPFIKLLDNYNIAANYLMEHYNSGKNNKHNDKEFILFVTTSEAWNFLSHLTFAFYVYKSSEIFITNIDRSFRHIERATLDIYKYLIIENKIKSANILQIRMEEIYNFGSSNSLNKITNQYENIIKRKVFSSE